MAERKDSEAKKPSAAKKPAEPAAEKPAAKKPAAKKPAAKKPAAKKPDKAAAKAPTAKTSESEGTTSAKKSEASGEPQTKSKAPARSGAKGGTRKAAGAKAGAKAKVADKEKQAPARPVVNARARYVRVAPRKARLVADQVRGLPLADAQTLLRFSARGAAEDIAKLIDSAAANAENNHDLVADDLMVSDIRVDEGPTLRRYRPRALGRATRINKRTSHIQVALTPED